VISYLHHAYAAATRLIPCCLKVFAGCLPVMLTENPFAAHEGPNRVVELGRAAIQPLLEALPAHALSVDASGKGASLTESQSVFASCHKASVRFIMEP